MERAVTKSEITGDFQMDLFDSPMGGRVKNDRTLMVWSFFGLGRQKTQRLPTYDDGTVRIEVYGTPEHGVANMWDKEILIYLVSLMQDKANRGEVVGTEMTFTAADLFRVVKREPGGSAYERLEESLMRLKSTQVKTNIETGGEGEDSGFSWISEYKMRYARNRKGEKVLRAVKVTVCSWLYRAVVKDGRILTYDSRYFDLGPLEKRLYEIARAHCGKQRGFKMGLEKLRRRVGYGQGPEDLKYFKRDILALAKKKSPLPEYGVMLVDPRDPRRLGVLVDPKAPTPRGRTALRDWRVFFFNALELSRIPAYAAVPELDDGGFPESKAP
jgi:plasmid replication initiation protein